MAGGGARQRRRRRWGWLDLLILALLLAAGVWLAWRVQTGLVYRWDWSAVPRSLLRQDGASGAWVPGLLLQGFLVTLKLVFWSSLLAALLGLVIGLGRVSRSRLPRLLATGYVQLVRNIPPLVFIFVFYFFFSSQLMPLLGLERWVDGLGAEGRAVLGFLAGPPRRLEAFMSGLICLAMLEAAYVAEIVRAGIQGIARGQWEAAASLGLGRGTTLRDVILPQALARITPPLASQFIALIKDSSIVSLISIQELTFMASQTVSTTRRVFEIWLTVAALYFLLCLLLSLLFRRLEQRLAAAERR